MMENNGGAVEMTIDINELRASIKTIGVMAVSTQELSELLDRLEAAEKERDDAAHQKALADSALRVAEGWERKCDALRALVDILRSEISALRAKIEQMERQEPVGVLHVGSYYGEELQDWEFEANQCVCDRLNERHVNNQTSLNLYALPGAQPAPSIPEFCPCCGNIMRACMCCPNEDCNAVTVTAEQAKYNKQHAVARKASGAAEPPPEAKT